MKVIILAAGYATRLYPLTENLPKALLKLGEKTILDYILAKIIELPDISEIALVTNAKFYRQFCDYAQELLVNGFPYEIRIINDGTVNDEVKLGALGDLELVLDEIGWDEDVLLLASDNIFATSLLPVYRDFLDSKIDVIVGKKIDEIKDLQRFAVAEINADNIIVGLEEKPALPKSDLAVFAIYFYKKSTLKLLSEYKNDGNNMDSPGRFPEWLYSKVPIKLHRIQGRCIDIGTVESYRDLQNDPEFN